MVGPGRGGAAGEKSSDGRWMLGALYIEASPRLQRHVGLNIHCQAAGLSPLHFMLLPSAFSPLHSSTKHLGHREVPGASVLSTSTSSHHIQMRLVSVSQVGKTQEMPSEMAQETAIQPFPHEPEGREDPARGGVGVVAFHYRPPLFLHLTASWLDELFAYLKDPEAGPL